MSKTRTLPYAFTKNGIGMLSSVLWPETAVGVNIRIMRAFTAIPEIMNNNALMMQRILSIEQHQTETDEKVNQILNGKHALTTDLAVKIESVIGLPAKVLLSAQR